ncbi:MAG: GTPase HflX [Treponema sp.]|nr:GTPase HflX [Treponema sp.]
MIINLQEENRKAKAFLVGETSLNELTGLVETLGMEISGHMILSRRTFSATYAIGSGKAQEIIDTAKEYESECIIFDFELSPTQQRNWEKLGNIPVFDRHETIIRIFADRARTKEAVIQVELAKLNYALPRLAHTYGDMARQRGGSYGSKGTGETQLQLDKRSISEKIEKLKIELEKVIKERETNRKKREKIPLPTCALVGYTNAGKSSLLNALTGADVFVEDKLFATLDPTTRRLSLAGSSGILLTDTVGFISNLPHNLIDAFKSTLEEAVRANLLLVVLDASDNNATQHHEAVMQVLSEIGALEHKQIIILNKIDECESIQLNNLRHKFPNAVCVSAKTKEGFSILVENILLELYGESQNFVLPYFDKNGKDSNISTILQEIRQIGVLENTKWLEDGVYINARLPVDSKVYKSINLLLHEH